MTGWLKICAPIVICILAAAEARAQRITLEIPYVKPGAALPKRYTGGRKSVSPPLVWANVPDGARELALVFEEAESGRVHWLLYSIPTKATSLPEDLPRDEVLSAPSRLTGTIQGITAFVKDSGPGYVGPIPSDAGERKYRFTLYALDARMGLQPGLDKASLLFMIKDHILATGEFTVKLGK